MTEEELKVQKERAAIRTLEKYGFTYKDTASYWEPPESLTKAYKTVMALKEGVFNTDYNELKRLGF